MDQHFEDLNERKPIECGKRGRGIDAELAAVSDLREKPGRTIRITATAYAIDYLLMPKFLTLPSAIRPF